MQIVVDDLRTLPQGDLHLRTSWDAIAWLKSHDLIYLDALWLDHDLGEDEEGFTDDIMPVVDYLSEIAYEGLPLRVGTIYVHSMNPVGGDNVVRVLQRWGYNVRRSPLPETTSCEIPNLSQKTS